MNLYTILEIWEHENDRYLCKVEYVDESENLITEVKEFYTKLCLHVDDIVQNVFEDTIILRDDLKADVNTKAKIINKKMRKEKYS